MKNPQLSVVVPMLDEQECVDEFWTRLCVVLEGMGVSYEVIFVDDGSSDATFERILSLAARHPAVRGLSLSRNFGHQMALFAGIRHASGDFTVTMDGDLQHPPELIPELWAQAQQGYDIVVTVRELTEDAPWWKRLTARAFYRIFSWLSDVDMMANTADFRLFNRQVRELISGLDERVLFLRGLFAWAGFRQKLLPYRAHRRRFGTSKYSLLRMLNFSLEGLTSFSVVPIRASLLCSGFSLLVAAAYTLYALYVKLILDEAVAGWTSLLILQAFFFSMVFIILGILGEYIAKIHLEAKKRPRYVVRSRTGWSSEVAAEDYRP